MLARVSSAMLVGVDGHVLTVEVHISGGLPAFNLVGLPDAAVREARERVRAAILSTGLEWPQKRVTVNIAPTGVRKSGAGLDVALALAILVVNGALPAGVLDGVGVLGELGLDGALRPVPGTLALVDALRRAGVTSVIVPLANAPEAALVGGECRVLPARCLGDAVLALKGEASWPDPGSSGPCGGGPAEVAPGWGGYAPTPDDDGVPDLSVVRGLASARRALEVAAAGHHHLLLVGPPGSGKTLLAHCLPSIMPPLEPAEALEATRVWSAAGMPVSALLDRRPFRAPHHTASAAALVGGGSGRPRPGEITLATTGALFLDELGEFAPSVLDALRQPLEERVVRIARGQGTVTFPADFLLVAASNPCPCGLGPPSCSCHEALRARYRRRLSAPLLDRFDLRMAVHPAAPGAPPGAPSSEVAERVAEAVARQEARYRARPWSRNARVPARALAADIPLQPVAGAALEEAARRRGWSGRGLAAARRVARTLADLDGHERVSPVHIAAAALREEVL